MFQVGDRVRYQPWLSHTLYGREYKQVKTDTMGTVSRVEDGVVYLEDGLGHPSYLFELAGRKPSPNDPRELVKLVTDLDGTPQPKGSPLVWDVPCRLWSTAGRAMLRKLAKDLEFPKGSFKIHFNPGGDAVPGDHKLHAESIYVVLSPGLLQGTYGYARTVRGLKDYVGGVNHDLPATYEGVLGLCRALLSR